MAPRSSAILLVPVNLSLHNLPWVTCYVINAILLVQVTRCRQPECGKFPRSNFCCGSILQVGTSIAAGIEFGWATNTTLSVTPSTATWGDTLLLQSTVSSLNPKLFNITTGTVQWTLDGVVLDTVTVTGEPFSLA